MWILGSCALCKHMPKFPKFSVFLTILFLSFRYAHITSSSHQSQLEDLDGELNPAAAKTGTPVSLAWLIIPAPHVLWSWSLVQHWSVNTKAQPWFFCGQKTLSKNVDKCTNLSVLAQLQDNLKVLFIQKVCYGTHSMGHTMRMMETIVMEW